jgi:hypothetical protein
MAVEFEARGASRGKSFRAGHHVIMNGKLVIESEEDARKAQRVLRHWGVYPKGEAPEEVVAAEKAAKSGDEEKGDQLTPGERKSITHDPSNRDVVEAAKGREAQKAEGRKPKGKDDESGEKKDTSGKVEGLPGAQS